MVQRLRLVVALAGLAAAPFAAALPVHAEIGSPWTAPSGTAVRLVAGDKDGGHLTGGVQIRLSPGWKTYWRYPGDSGVPPRFDWSGSENVAAIEVLWPAPVRFDDGGSFSIGYKRDVTLPFRVTPRDAAKPVDLKLGLDFAVCEKICQPATASLALTVPAEGAGSASPALASALAAVPAQSPVGATGGTAVETAVLEGQPDGGKPQTIRVVARVEDPAKADLFVEGPTEDWALPLPERETGPDGRTVFVLPVEGIPKGADVGATKLRFTLVDRGHAVEVDTALSAR